MKELQENETFAQSLCHCRYHHHLGLVQAKGFGLGRSGCVGIWVREVGVEGFWLGKSGFVGLLPSSTLLLISLPFFFFVVDPSSLFLQRLIYLPFVFFFVALYCFFRELEFLVENFSTSSLLVHKTRVSKTRVATVTLSL